MEQNSKTEGKCEMLEVLRWKKDLKAYGELWEKWIMDQAERAATWVMGLPRVWGSKPEVAKAPGQSPDRYLRN